MRTAGLSAAVFAAAVLLVAAVLVFAGAPASPSKAAPTPPPAPAPVDLTGYTGPERTLLERIQQTAPPLLADPAETLTTIRDLCTTLPPSPLPRDYLDRASTSLSTGDYYVARAAADIIMEKARATVCAEGRVAMGGDGGDTGGN